MCGMSGSSNSCTGTFPSNIDREAYTIYVYHAVLHNYELLLLQVIREELEKDRFTKEMDLDQIQFENAVEMELHSENSELWTVTRVTRTVSYINMHIKTKAYTLDNMQKQWTGVTVTCVYIQYNYIIIIVITICSCPEIKLRDTQECWILIDDLELFQPSIIDLT